MNNCLYHFSPRKFESEEKTIAIVTSIFEKGFFLSEEKLDVKWKDPYAVNGRQRDLSAIQLRFCLTAITNQTELIAHADRFGLIGFEFEEDFIVKIGGFPVFYVPTPRSENADIEEYKGVSLLYRLGDMQEVMEYIIRHNLIQTNDIDLENVLGSIKFLANICYPTQRRIDKPLSEQISYYNQREWRVIYNLTPPAVKIGYCENNKTIESVENTHIRNFINKIFIFNKKSIPEEIRLSIFKKIQELVIKFQISCEVELVDVYLK